MTRRAVGIMAKAPVAGLCKTRLGERIGHEAAAALCRAMLLDTLEAAMALALERLVVLAAPEHDGVRRLRDIVPASIEVLPQCEGGLGVRLVAAFELLNSPSTTMALIGTDSPHMDWATAEKGLSTFGDVLLGPAQDGGYYLIGLKEKRPELFDDIPWSSAHVLSKTRERCSTLGLRLHELPTCFDIDEEKDLRSLAASLSINPSRAPHTAAWLSARVPAVVGAHS